MSKKRPNILINNVVPLNNGDVALFLSLYNALNNKGFQVKIATYYYKQAIKLYPNLPFVKELGDYKLFVKLPFLKPFLLPILFLLSKSYRESSIIIGTPGGYINSNYTIKNSLSVFKVAKYFRKKTYIYSQSVGPLNTKDKKFLKKLILNSIDFIFVRDSYSKTVLEELNIPKNKYRLTKDAAFLLTSDLKPSEKTNKIAISVRTWNFDNRNINNYKNLITELVKFAVTKNFEIEFLSTCQGLKNYKNDALIAQEIYDALPIKFQKKSKVLSNYFTFSEFQNKLTDYDFVIGTRLHMCIIALTNKIPAFNISYEIKGKECFEYLGLSDYSIDYNENVENALLKFENFILNQITISNKISKLIPKINQQCNKDVDFLIDLIKNYR